MTEFAPGIEQRGFPTRAVVASLGVAGVLTAVECVGSRRIWRDEEAAVVFHGEPGENEKMWLTLPGLGVGPARAELIAAGVGAAVDEPSAYLSYPHRKPSAEKIAQAVTESMKAQGAKRLGIYGHSLGGRVLTAVAPHLPEGVIDEVVLDCSPASFHDTRPSPKIQAGKYLARFPYDGGALTAGAIGFMNFKPDPETKRGGLGDRLKARINNARECLGPQNCSSVAWNWQLRLLDSSDLSEMQQDVQPALAPDADVVFIRPGRPEADDTVNVERALESWEKVFGSIGLICIENGGHGISVPTADEYIKAIRDWRGVSEPVAA